MMDLLKRIWKEEEGQGLVEYGLILLLMVVIALGVITVFRPQLEAIFNRISSSINAGNAAIKTPTNN
ncbi:Flp family type IVb pilin [Proteiniclasticum ruminis]|uniref:Pilus assembly protein Flp/PilA n=1 Tax=Proteiniclasticum ruminis TaxID=398199 RepID=A0A1G8RBH9_9CLOT|nr:Flp family type IVb pilin [Proteiniclasticum ruminis]SDJ13730.1 pilus assembly protein Flp/PilA [Proteiniclasticum ruminis]